MSPTLSNVSVPSFRAMAAANVTSTGKTVEVSREMLSPKAMKAKNGPIQFGVPSGLPNLPPRTHSAPPAFEEGSEVVVPKVNNKPNPPPMQQGLGWNGPMPMGPMPPSVGLRPMHPFVRAPFPGPGPVPFMPPPEHMNYYRPPYGAPSSYISYRPPPPSNMQSPTTEGIPKIIPQKVVKKIAIVNPETGEDVTKDIVKVPTVVIPQVPTAEPKKSTVVIVNPADNKPVDLSQLVNAEITEEKVKADQEVFGAEDSSIFSGGELSEMEDLLDDHEDEEEEEEFTGPRMLKEGQLVDYPRTMVQFTPPATPGGTWVYQRDFLLQFKFICTWKPEMELEKVQKARAANRREYKSGSGTGRNRNGSTSIRATPAVLTNRAQNAWARLGEKALPEDDLVLREAKGLLNKLTYDKFDSISDKMIALGIMSKTIMPGMIDLLFDKAVDEPKFAPMYAQLCLKITRHELDQKIIESGQEIQKVSEFRKFIITKCQAEYEKKKAWSRTRLAKLAEKNSEAAKEENEKEADSSVARPEPTVKPESSGELTEEDYELIKTKRRVLGNMRFIGELFNVGLLPEKIMHAVIQELLRDIETPEEEEVESFCKLFTTVGPKLDIPAAVKQIEAYLHRMNLLATNKLLSTRVRFMVLDVLDLRKVKWAGKDKDLPKTLADFQMELLEKQQARSSSQQRSTTSSRPSNASKPSLIYQSGNANSSQTSLSGREDHSGRNRMTTSSRKTDKSGFTTVSTRASPSLRSATPSSSTPATPALNRFDLLNATEPSSTTPKIVIEEEWKEEDKKNALSKIKSALGEYVRFKKVEDFAQVWSESVPSAHQKDALVYLLSNALDSDEKTVDALCSLFSGPLALDGKIIFTAFKETCSSLDDLVADAPRSVEYAGRLIASAIDAGLIKGEASLLILSDVALRDTVPAAKALLFLLATVKEASVKNDPKIASALGSADSAVTTTAIKFKLLPSLSTPIQVAILRTRMTQLPRPFEDFLVSARKLIIDELDQAEHIPHPTLLGSISSAAFERLRSELPNASIADLESNRLPCFLPIISILQMDQPCSLAILNALTHAHQFTSLDWLESVVKALHSSGIIPSEHLTAWREDKALEKEKALERLAPFIASLSK